VQWLQSLYLKGLLKSQEHFHDLFFAICKQTEKSILEIGKLDGPNLVLFPLKQCGANLCLYINIDVFLFFLTTSVVCNEK